MIHVVRVSGDPDELPCLGFLAGGRGRELVSGLVWSVPSGHSSRRTPVMHSGRRTPTSAFRQILQHLSALTLDHAIILWHSI